MVWVFEIITYVHKAFPLYRKEVTFKTIYLPGFIFGFRNDRTAIATVIVRTTPRCLSSSIFGTTEQRDTRSRTAIYQKHSDLKTEFTIVN